MVSDFIDFFMFTEKVVVLILKGMVDIIEANNSFMSLTCKEEEVKNYHGF